MIGEIRESMTGEVPIKTPIGIPMTITSRLAVRILRKDESEAFNNGEVPSLQESEMKAFITSTGDGSISLIVDKLYQQAISVTNDTRARIPLFF
jgi:hypothetical protein